MNRHISGASLVTACLLLVACSNLSSRSNPDYDASRSHHRPDGFVNRYAERSDKPGLWRWQFERLRDGLPKPPAAPIVGVANAAQTQLRRACASVELDHQAAF
jgi:hypothetical protein